ncbi:unnamed protein product [Bemisia tabaci]|uniref:Uncharacterized protein n=1 Tax=Bemisia tabaci TaxID=7038 RepID=A0A9P0EWW2_BEMTA|nr:unnamed protein product [Bemisia tabaci]
MCNQSCHNFQMEGTLRREEEEGNINEPEIMIFFDENLDYEPGSSTPSTIVPDQTFEIESDSDESELEIEETPRVLRSNKEEQYTDPQPSDQKSQIDPTKIPGPFTRPC